MFIERITNIDERTANALQLLIPELTNDQNRIPTIEDLEKVISSPNNFVFIAKNNDGIEPNLTCFELRFAGPKRPSSWHHFKRTPNGVLFLF